MERAVANQIPPAEAGGPRIPGAPSPPSLFARIVYWFAKRRLGRVPLPVRIHAVHGRLFQGYARMELAQDKARRVPFDVKALASIRVAMRVGCPF
jgi:hypothetical protein